jgi:hypothetical protein
VCARSPLEEVGTQTQWGPSSSGKSSRRTKAIVVKCCICRPPGARGRVSRSSRDTRARARFGQKPRRLCPRLPWEEPMLAERAVLRGSTPLGLRSTGMFKSECESLFSQVFGAAPAQGVLLCMCARHAVEIRCVSFPEAGGWKRTVSTVGV